MGILNGNIILNTFQRGLYNRFATNYEIRVDGELLRYKGMTGANMAKHDAEHAVANGSFTYLCRLINQLEIHLGKKPHQVTVYMDGKRVTNKIIHATNFQLDASLIRNIFTKMCEGAGMFVENLEYGESELQMHIKRNQERELIVYITCDTDLISILYGHKPKVNDKSVEFRKNMNFYNDNQFDIVSCSLVTSNSEPNIFQDSNFVYKFDDCQQIKDSIVWLNCSKDTIILYGMDNTMCNNLLEPIQFRSFMALCGTDFTPSALTSSFIVGLLKIEKCDAYFVNNLSDLFDIFISLILIGFKNNGCLKQKRNQNVGMISRQSVIMMLKYYIDYVSTGCMTDSAIPQPPMFWLTRYVIWCAKNKRTFKTKKAQIDFLANFAIGDLLKIVSDVYDDDANCRLFCETEFNRKRAVT